MKQMSDVETTMSSRPPRLPLPMGFPRRRCDETGLLLPYVGPCFKGPPDASATTTITIRSMRLGCWKPCPHRALAGRARGAPGPADDLFELHQDPSGGLAAVDARARRAGVGAASRVLDLCAGLG